MVFTNCTYRPYILSAVTRHYALLTPYKKHRFGARAFLQAIIRQRCSQAAVISLSGRPVRNMPKPVTRPVIEDRRAVPLLLKAYGGDKLKVAEHLSRDVRFVQKWDARHRAGKGFGNKPGCGPKRSVTGAGITAAKRMATGRIEKSATKIAQRLQEMGHTKTQVNATTVLRWLKTGRSPVRFLPWVRRHKLTDVHKHKRRNWGREHRTVDWSTVLYTDSHIFQTGKHTGRKRQQRANARKQRETHATGLKLHVYAGMGAGGTTDLFFVTGTTGVQFRSSHTGKICKGVGAEEYCSVIRESLIPCGKTLFGRADFAVYQDGASAHTARLTRTCWNEYPEVNLIQAAPLSPDLNLIENLWQILDRKLDGREFRSVRGLKEAATAAWRSIPTSTCEQLVEGMHQRLQKVEANHGGHIERNIYS